jgi:hypothetical protein
VTKDDSKFRFDARQKSNLSKVDEFIKSNVRPELQAIVSALRDLMRELAPLARETIVYGIPAWKGRKILAVLSPTKQDITLAFSRGAEFEDRYGLLQGVGKVSKHLKIKRLEDIDKEVLTYYVKQALALDGK